MYRADVGGGRRWHRAMLVGFFDSSNESRGDGPDLPELARLVRTAGGEVGCTITQRRDRVDSAYYVGSGKAHEISDSVRTEHCDVIVFDNELSPRQVRNLERVCKCRVVDRTELILGIFAKHARSTQAQLQVELARLEYELPRLRRMWTHLSRIHGGGGGASPGALRGPGEKQLETDRRQLRHRIIDLRRELGSVENRRQREVDHRTDLFSVSLVGYTNSGKSTLLNSLTGANALVADQLFSTLDTLTRVWTLPGRRRVLLSDTIGFIDRLPHHLVSSFHATLAETRSADLVLHVVDAGSERALEHAHAVRDVLEKIGASQRPTLVVINKADRVGSLLELRVLRNEFPDHVVVSAATGDGLLDLGITVERLLEEAWVEVAVHCFAGDGKAFALLQEHGRILETQFDEDASAIVRAMIDPREEGRIQKHITANGGRCQRIRTADFVKGCEAPARS